MTTPRQVSASEALDLHVQGAMLLDVREVNEFEAGHAPRAVHVPLSELPDQLHLLPTNRLIICVCRSGGRSTRASEFLAEKNFDVANLDGGMLAWAEFDAPLEGDDEPSIL